MQLWFSKDPANKSLWTGRANDDDFTRRCSGQSDRWSFSFPFYLSKCEMVQVGALVTSPLLSRSPLCRMCPRVSLYQSVSFPSPAAIVMWTCCATRTLNDKIEQGKLRKEQVSPGFAVGEVTIDLPVGADGVDGHWLVRKVKTGHERSSSRQLVMT